MGNVIKKIIKFNWMNSKFFIRLFLILVAIVQVIKVKVMIKTEVVDTEYALGMMGFVAVLIGLYRKYKKKA